jgi:hypothetical protein
LVHSEDAAESSSDSDLNFSYLLGSAEQPKSELKSAEGTKNFLEEVSDEEQPLQPKQRRKAKVGQLLDESDEEIVEVFQADKRISPKKTKKDSATPSLKELLQRKDLRIDDVLMERAASPPRPHLPPRPDHHPVPFNLFGSTLETPLDFAPQIHERFAYRHQAQVSLYPTTPIIPTVTPPIVSTTPSSSKPTVMDVEEEQEKGEAKPVIQKKWLTLKDLLEDIVRLGTAIDINSNTLDVLVGEQKANNLFNSQAAIELSAHIGKVLALWRDIKESLTKKPELLSAEYQQLHQQIDQSFSDFRNILNAEKVDYAQINLLINKIDTLEKSATSLVDKMNEHSDNVKSLEASLKIHDQISERLIEAANIQTEAFKEQAGLNKDLINAVNSLANLCEKNLYTVDEQKKLHQVSQDTAAILSLLRAADLPSIKAAPTKASSKGEKKATTAEAQVHVVPIIIPTTTSADAPLNMDDYSTWQPSAEYTQEQEDIARAKGRNLLLKKSSHSMLMITQLQQKQSF